MQEAWRGPRLSPAGREGGVAVPSPRGGQAMGPDSAGGLAGFFPRLEEGLEETLKEVE